MPLKPEFKHTNKDREAAINREKNASQLRNITSFISMLFDAKKAFADGDYKSAQEHALNALDVLKKDRTAASKDEIDDLKKLLTEDLVNKGVTSPVFDFEGYLNSMKDDK